MALSGFFSELPLPTTFPSSKKQSSPKVQTCEDCGLYAKCSTPKFPVFGEGKKRILIVGECPSFNEDQTGIQNQGQSSQLLRSELYKLGINLDKDCWKTNAVICHPKKGTPTKREVKICRTVVLEKVIQDLKPKLIIVLGKIALESLLYKQTDTGNFAKWRGLVIPDQKIQTHIVPLYHPSAILKKAKDKFLKTLWLRDLKVAVKALNKPFKDFRDYPTKVTSLTDFKGVVDVLEGILKEEDCTVVFDYETTGLKPYSLGHKLLTIGFCTQMDHAFSFPFQYPGSWTNEEFQTIKKLWVQILQRSRIKKVAHNMKFEDMWSQIILDTKTNGWEFCTLLGQHILDNRGGISGLKHQTYVRFGIYGYDDSTKPYIKSEKGSGFNRMHEAPLEDVLKYNALDCLFTYWLYDSQYFDEYDDSLFRAYSLFHKGSAALGRVQINGINIDEVHYAKEKIRLTDLAQEKEGSLLSSSEAELFFEDTGRELLLSSNKDLIHLFFTILELTPTKKTPGGAPSVDVESLAEMTNRFAKELVSLRKIIKLKDTYISQITSEVQEGKLHPFFNLNVPVTYRSSCIAKGTPIHVYDTMPTHKNIEEIKVGDKVYCYTDTFGVDLKPVLWAGKTGHKEVIRVYWEHHFPVEDTYVQKGYLDCTPEHRIRLATGEYVEAQHLLDPEKIQGKVQKEMNDKVITKIEWIQKEVDVYNLEVEEFHNFIAGGINVRNSAGPNFQNIPIHNKEAKECIRGGIIPSKGNKLLEVDYGSLEVRVIGCLSRDRTILKYLNDSSTDMHRDQACEIFKLTQEQLKGTDLRTGTKSMFIFAEFYGSFYKPCAAALWNAYKDSEIPALGGLTVSEHLGFVVYESFENHMKNIEKKFWKKYSGVRNWQNKMVEQYEQKGFIENPFGFKFQGLMGRNNIYNYPVQSTGFHLLLWSLSQINQWLQKKQLKTKIVGQIHDSIVFDLYPPEQTRVLKQVNKIMTQKTKDKFKFLICPLIIDADITEVDQPWSTKDNTPIRDS